MLKQGISKTTHLSLSVAAATGKCDYITQYLKNHCIGRNEIAEALLKAAQNGHAKIVQDLLSYSELYICYVTQEQMMNALRAATRNGHNDTISEIITFAVKSSGRLQRYQKINALAHQLHAQSSTSSQAIPKQVDSLQNTFTPQLTLGSSISAQTSSSEHAQNFDLNEKAKKKGRLKLTF